MLEKLNWESVPSESVNASMSRKIVWGEKLMISRIKFKDGEKTEYAHTLNGTLVATSRGPIAILENFQQEDGSVKIPEVLIPYTGFSVITPKNPQ